MNKAIFAVIIGIAGASARTDAAERVQPKVVQSIDADELEAAIYKSTGGKVVKPGTMTGKLVYVNAQKSAPAAWLKANAQALRDNLKIVTEVADGEFALPSPKVVGSATLFVIDDAKMPRVLCAPEDRWAMVNVAPLKEGAGAKEVFFRARVQKELTRGLSLLMGAQNSRYPLSIMKCITKSEQLDDIVGMGVPVDVTSRFRTYMAGYGIVPGIEQDYRKACQEGWAPAPTDTVQKVIWEKVHEIPSKPIKIEYNEKRDAGK